MPIDKGFGQRVGCKEAGVQRFVAFFFQFAADRSCRKEQVVVAALAPGGARIDADQVLQFDLYSGFLAGFAHGGLRDGFARVDSAAGQGPDLEVPPLDQQHVTRIEHRYFDAIGRHFSAGR